MNEPDMPSPNPHATATTDQSNAHIASTPGNGDSFPGYEQSDADSSRLAQFAGALVLTVALVLPFLSWWYWRMEGTARRADAARPVGDIQLPPPPRLQVNAPEDLKVMEAEKTEELTTYGWVDRRQGVARIPIERAMELLATRGFPEPQVKEDAAP